MKAPLLASRGRGKGLQGDGWFLLARGEGDFPRPPNSPAPPKTRSSATGWVPGQSATGRSRATPQEREGPSCPPACGLEQTKRQGTGTGQATGTPPACMAKTGTRITRGQRESAAAHGSMRCRTCQPVHEKCKRRAVRRSGGRVEGLGADVPRRTGDWLPNCRPP